MRKFRLVILLIAVVVLAFAVTAKVASANTVHPHPYSLVQGWNSVIIDEVQSSRKFADVNGATLVVNIRPVWNDDTKEIAPGYFVYSPSNRGKNVSILLPGEQILVFIE